MAHFFTFLVQSESQVSQLTQPLLCIDRLARHIALSLASDELIEQTQDVLVSGRIVDDHCAHRWFLDLFSLGEPHPLY